MRGENSQDPNAVQLAWDDEDEIPSTQDSQNQSQSQTDDNADDDEDTEVEEEQEPAKKVVRRGGA